jgi:hypothetical protein
VGSAAAGSRPSRARPRRVRRHRPSGRPRAPRQPFDADVVGQRERRMRRCADPAPPLFGACPSGQDQVLPTRPSPPRPYLGSGAVAQALT